MTKYCKDMCIICFAPKRYDSQWLYSPSEENAHETCVSEIGSIFQDLIQVSLSFDEERPQFVCNYCKTKLITLHKFKLKALDAYKRVSTEIHNAELIECSLIENPLKVEEITVFDVSTKRTEKYEIQYLDEDQEDNVEVIDVDNDLYASDMPDAHSNGSNRDQSNISSNKRPTPASLEVKCQLCSKIFASNEAFNIHWKEHEELPQYSFGTKYQCNDGASEEEKEIIDIDGKFTMRFKKIPPPNGDCLKSSRETSIDENMVPSNRVKRTYLPENLQRHWRKHNTELRKTVKQTMPEVFNNPEQNQNSEEFINHQTNSRVFKKVKMACAESCALKCSRKISERERHLIFNQFWKLTDSERRRFYIQHVQKIPFVRRPDSTCKKNFTFKYSLSDGNGIHHVICKTFFLATLSVSAKKIYDAFHGK